MSARASSQKIASNAPCSKAPHVWGRRPRTDTSLESSRRHKQRIQSHRLHAKTGTKAGNLSARAELSHEHRTNTQSSKDPQVRGARQRTKAPFNQQIREQAKKSSSYIASSNDKRANRFPQQSKSRQMTKQCSISFHSSRRAHPRLQHAQRERKVKHNARKNKQLNTPAGGRIAGTRQAVSKAEQETHPPTHAHAPEKAACAANFCAPNENGANLPAVL